MLRLATELGGQPVNDAGNREFLDLGRDGAGVETADIQQRIQQVGHCRQRIFLAFDHCQRALVFNRATQRAV